MKEIDRYGNSGDRDVYTYNEKCYFIFNTKILCRVNIILIDLDVSDILKILFSRF